MQGLVVVPTGVQWHQGQQPQYLPRERGFDRFSGLPFSVDDGEGYASNCTNKTVAVDADNLFIGSTGAEKSATSFMEPPHTVAWEQQDPARRPPDAQALRLGPSLPLPSIRQTNNSSVIVQQPVDLVCQLRMGFLLLALTSDTSDTMRCRGYNRINVCVSCVKLWQMWMTR